MEQIIICKYWNPQLNIAFNNWQQVFILNPVQKQLNAEVYKGNLVYRMPGTYKRIGYAAIKSGLIKKNIKINIPFQQLPF